MNVVLGYAFLNTFLRLHHANLFMHSIPSNASWKPRPRGFGVFALLCDLCAFRILFVYHMVRLVSQDNYEGVSLWVKWTPEVRKFRRSKIFLFLYSLGHTEAKKIPEFFFHRYHLACFFQMKILKKLFLAKTHQEGPKIGYSKKIFFCKMTRKNLEKFKHVFL